MDDKQNKLDIFIIVIFPLVSALLSFVFNANAFWSVILFFVFPAIYLSVRSPKQIKRALVFSAFAGIPVIIMVDYIAHISQQWLIPNSIIEFRMFRLVTVEVIAWAVFNFYIVIMFYKHFLDRSYYKKLLPPQMMKMLIFILISMIIFLFLYLYSPEKLKIHYFYLIFGLTLILVPVIIQLTQYPKMISKFFVTAAYFFYLSFLYEVTALKLGWWLFPKSTFLGWVNIFGVNFPFEEMFFWLILFSMACITAYERFDENN